MQVGNEASYIDKKGERHLATIVRVRPAGPSGFKTLDLVYRSEGEDVAVENLPHENDAEPGAAFWLEKGVARKSIDAPPAPATAVEVETPPQPPARKRGGRVR